MTRHLFEDIARTTTHITEMEALDIPVKLIRGENDPYLNVGVAEDLRSHLSDTSLRRIPAGHRVQIDEPELVASAMLS
jgi:haloalkane dehalogenase